MIHPILAQQDQKRQGWDRQAWRVAAQSKILVRLHYRGVVRPSVMLRDSADEPPRLSQPMERPGR